MWPFLAFVVFSTVIVADWDPLAARFYDVPGRFGECRGGTMFTDPAGGLARNPATSGQGESQFLQTSPGVSSLSASAPAFARLQRSQIVLLVDTPTTMNLTSGLVR